MGNGFLDYFFCCWRDHNLEEHEHPVGRCILLQRLTKFIKDLYYSIFRGSEVERIVPSGEPVATTLPPTSAATNTVMLHPPTPLLNTDPQDNEPITREAKCPIPPQENSPSTRAENASDAELKDNNLNLDELKSYVESAHPSAELAAGSDNLSSSSENEDVCAICLDGYSPENPRISLQCTHQYHLSCAYEWMERSESCAICSKVALFAEET